MQLLTEKVRYLVIPDVGNVSFNVQTSFLTISENFRYTYYFDNDGRFMGGFFDGITYKRGLDNTVLMKYFTEDQTKVRDFLSWGETRDLIDDVLRRVRRIREGLVDEGQEDVVLWLERILLWDFERLEAERAAFQTIYKPVSILPPDQYMAVVLQVTEGCSWNQCTFCTFYRGRKFRIKSAQECRQHAQQVKQFLGSSIHLRKSIFLADANALIIPQSRLIEILQVIHDEFPVEAPKAGYDYVLQGIYAFLDIFGAERKSCEQYRELRDYGVKRIYIGLETGDDELFRLLNKPGSPAECIEAVHTIKSAGIQVGIIMLAGAGGDSLSQQHVQHSVEAITAMQLGAGDIVYISPLVVSGEEEYSARMQKMGIRALQPAEVQQQVATIKTALRQPGSDRPRVTLYNIGDFVY